jgi:hypothetical protein
MIDGLRPRAAVLAFEISLVVIGVVLLSHFIAATIFEVTAPNGTATQIANVILYHHAKASVFLAASLLATLSYVVVLIANVTESYRTKRKSLLLMALALSFIMLFYLSFPMNHWLFG